jgi:hypothetical protein
MAGRARDRPEEEFAPFPGQNKADVFHLDSDEELSRDIVSA